MIGTLILSGGLAWSQRNIGLALSAAITVSGAVQMFMVIWGCRKAGVKFGLRRPRFTPGVRRLVTLGIPGIISAGITQINLLVSHMIALSQSSAASWLTYADRLYQLPLGMIGIAMGVALLRLRASGICFIEGFNARILRAREHAHTHDLGRYFGDPECITGLHLI